MTRSSRLLIASLLAVTTADAQQPASRTRAREDSALVAAVMHVIAGLPEGKVAVNPEYHILTGEPGNSSRFAVAHSRSFLSGVVGDDKHVVTFQPSAALLPDPAKCGVMQRLSVDSTARARGDCLLRGVTAAVAVFSFKIAESAGTIIVSIEENNTRGTSYGRSVALTVERRGTQWIVTAERILVEQ